MLALLLFAALLTLMACGGGVPTGPDSGDPREAHIVSETARFASMLHVSVRGIVTDERYMVPAGMPTYPGEKVPAAGWYKDGVARYYRPVVLERTLEGGSGLAAHESCHAIHDDEDGANKCAAVLLGY